ncbi:MAG: CoA transferase [Candidatus Latescibacterota bacterium]|nr:CoA transferase [Candidatus Latescibacterota bacterium]
MTKSLLSHIRVLDLSRVLAGPFCTMCLADLGAEVIKVERPGSGDDTRRWGPPFVGGESAYFCCCNRNKRSLTLNLKSEEGQRLALNLAAECDVVVENFRPGTIDRLGLGYAALRAVNPGIVLCSITGFGQSGPRSLDSGYDILIQGLSGLMSITGDADGEPMKVGVAITDVNAGLFASQAILAALLARERTGEGQQIDISLYDSAVASLVNVGASYLLAGEVGQRHGNAHSSIVPYQVFACADGPFVVAVGNDSQWRAFCAAFEREDLLQDERFCSNESRVAHRDALIPLLVDMLGRLGRADCEQRLRSTGVPCGSVQALEAVFADPHLHHRGLVQPVEHPTAGTLSLVGSPVVFGDTATQASAPPPRLGEHSGQILRELGLGAVEIDELRQAGVI